MRLLKKYLILIFLLGWLSYTVIEKTIINYRLKQYGIVCKGVIQNKKYIGGKGTINLEYYFKTQKDEFFKGETNNENYNVGDSIYVVYIKSNPDVNASKSFIDKY